MDMHLRSHRVSTGLGLSALALVGALFRARPTLADSMGSHGMGPHHGMMGHQGMGPQGMDAQAMGGPGGMFRRHESQMAGAGRGDGGWHRQERDARGQHFRGREVTEASVTEFLEARVKHMDNPRLKVGEVTAKDDKVIRGDMVTVDNSLVSRFEFDRANGRMQQVK